MEADRHLDLTGSICRSLFFVCPNLMCVTSILLTCVYKNKGQEETAQWRDVTGASHTLHFFLSRSVYPTPVALSASLPSLPDHAVLSV